MAKVTFLIKFGVHDRSPLVKIKDHPSNTTRDELTRIATDEFEDQFKGVPKAIVLNYYDKDFNRWMKVPKNYTLSNGEQLWLEVEYEDEKAQAAAVNKVVITNYESKITTTLNSKNKAQGLVYIVGMYNASGANVDVKGMERVFEESLNFAVVRETNLSPDDLKCLIKAAASIDYGLKCKYIAFYYAGHGGITAQGDSFVCPISDTNDIVYKERDIIHVLETSKAATSGKCLLFFFDCCMNPGSSTTMRQSPPDLAASPTQRSSNCLVVNATFFGETALGDATFGGQWTRVLSKKLAEDKELLILLQETNAEVNAKCNQIASMQSNLKENKLNLKGTAKCGGISPLQQKPTQEQLETVLKEYNAQYNRIGGRVMGLDYHTREDIRMNNFNFGTGKIMEVMIDALLQGNPDYTWNDFIKAAKKDDLNKLARDTEVYLRIE